MWEFRHDVCGRWWMVVGEDEVFPNVMKWSRSYANNVMMLSV
jgi:hypothetical protein